MEMIIKLKKHEVEKLARDSIYSEILNTFALTHTPVKKKDIIISSNKKFTVFTVDINTDKLST